MRNMVIKRRGNLVIVHHNTNAPGEEEWLTYEAAVLDAVKENNGDIARVRSLVITDGGGPTPAQRKHANEALNGRNIRVAVISSSPIIRGVVTAFSWFNKTISSFTPLESDKAFAHVEIPTGLWDPIRQDIIAMRAELKRSVPPKSGA